ncbi:MAG: hypothetical protein R3E66_22340 [bacterium]
MTKINGTSSPVDTPNVDVSPQPTEAKTEGPKAESHSGGSSWAEDSWLSKAADFGASALDLVGDAAASAAKQSGVAALARTAISGVETVDAAAITLGNAAHELLVEEKYKSLTLDPTAALDRVVAGANETMREVYGKEALQMTAHPDLDDLKYTVEVLSGSTGKLDQGDRRGLARRRRNP